MKDGRGGLSQSLDPLLFYKQNHMNKFEEVLKNYNQLKSKEDFLVDIEKEFDNSNWDEIMQTVVEADILHQKSNLKEEIIDSIINYVNERKKITFKQWKVLRLFISTNKHKPRKFKYEK